MIRTYDNPMGSFSFPACSGNQRQVALAPDFAPLFQPSK